MDTASREIVGGDRELNLIKWGEEIEIAVVSALCVLGGMMGTRMKYHARKASKKQTFDHERFWSGLYLSAGAGLVTGLLGQGLHLNKAFLVGASIVAGYAGGRRFFDWLQRLLSVFTARRLLDSAKEGAEEMKKALGDDEGGEEDDPP